MSQVTEQSVRFQTALASIKLIQASAVLDLTEDDFDFLTSNKVWIDRKSGSAGMPRPISYAVFCLKKKKKSSIRPSLIFCPGSPILYDTDSTGWTWRIGSSIPIILSPR